MSKKFRKVLAAILAGTMVLGSGVVANAAEGTGEGKGDLDIVEATDVFNVVLPTDSGEQFNYILDPTGIIAETNGAKYVNASASFVPGKTMYFRQEPASPNNVATYTDVSDPIKAYNKSTMTVEIKVQAKVSTPSGIEMATTLAGVAGGGTANTATPSIYLALQDGVNPDEAITVAGIVATSSITDASTQYETVYATDSKTYKKQLNATASNAKPEDDFDGLFQSYSFNLTGACNDDGKWVGMKAEDLPKVSLVWTIEPPAGITAGNDLVSITSAGVVSVKGTATKNYKGMTITVDLGTFTMDGDPNVEWDTSDWNATTGGTLRITLRDAWKDAIKNSTTPAKATVTFTDDTVIEMPITIS